MRGNPAVAITVVIVGGLLSAIASATGLYIVAEWLGNDLVVWSGLSIIRVNDPAALLTIIGFGVVLGVLGFIVAILTWIAIRNRNKSL